MSLPCRRNREHDGACIHCTIEAQTSAIVAAIHETNKSVPLWRRFLNLFR
jgi:hypothetical protein